MAKATVVGFSELLGSLESGRTPQGTMLGGNVLHETTLLTFAAAGYGPAKDYLRSNYLQPVANQVFKARRKAPDILDSDELLSELYMRLFGENKQEKFSGRSGLERWLRVVAARLVADNQRRSHGKVVEVKPPDDNNPWDRVEDDELLERVDEWFRAERKTLCDLIKRVVVLLWTCGVNNNVIASVINRHAGHTSRIREEALQEIRDFCGE